MYKQFAKDQNTSQRTRHINIRYIYLKDRIESRDIKIEYIRCKSRNRNIKQLSISFFNPLTGRLF